MRNFLFFLGLSLATFNIACTTAESPTANANSMGANGVRNINAEDLPPGFSTSPVPVNGSIPGIPNPNDPNANKMPAGNIPGIPDPSKIGKTPQPKNTPPIPGIPDQETLKKQMNTPLQDVNIVNNPSKTTTAANNRSQENTKGNTRQP